MPAPRRSCAPRRGAAGPATRWRAPTIRTPTASTPPIRNAAALFDVSPLYKYRITGRDAARLLDRMVTRDVTKCAVGQVLLHAVVRRARQGHRRRHGQPPRRAHVPPHERRAVTLRWLVDERRRAWTSTIEDVSERTARARAPGPALARDPPAALPGRPRARSSTSGSCTRRCATSRSRSPAPATPATWATRSGSTPSARSRCGTR